ncbi:hypothetical protein GQ472_05130 [archaeon]|nr:hypothetical protein [archaeon]
MKDKKLIILTILILATCIANTAYAAPPHAIVGNCQDAADSTPADSSLVTAFIETRPGETIHDTVGVTGDSNLTNGYNVNLGGLSSAWAAGEILIIEVEKTVDDDTYFDMTRVIITNEGFDQAPEMQLRSITSPHIALIMGKITDIDTGDEVEDADIFIECLANTEFTSATSDSQGNYYAVLECPVDATVRVTATKNSESGSEAGTVESIGTIGTEIDIGLAHIDVSIPEFPIAAIPALLSMFSFGLVRKRLF